MSTENSIRDYEDALEKMMQHVHHAEPEHWPSRIISIGETPDSLLIRAVQKNEVEKARQLLQCGADVNVVSDSGSTPLTLAAREGYIEMVELLFQHGVDVNALDQGTLESAISMAASGGFMTITRRLLWEDADPEAGASSALIEAAKADRITVARYLLLQWGVNVNATDSFGETALTYACLMGHMDMVAMLLEIDADVDHENNNGRTPLMIAARYDNIELVAILLIKGADVFWWSTKDGHTALSMAYAGGHTFVISYLHGYIRYQTEGPGWR